MDQMGRLTRGAFVTALIAIAGAAAVLYHWQNARPLWLDEEMIAINIRDRSFTELAGRLWLDQSAPLGWLALQRLVLLTLGSSELALRAVPALFGVATVFTAFFVGTRWLTTPGCAIFVLLCSFGQWIFLYAVELKSYSADTFFGLLLPALAVATGTGSSIESQRKRLVIWTAAAAIGHWFSLGGALVLPACGVVLAISLPRTRQHIKWLAVAGSIVVASFAIHYLLSIRHTQASESLRQYWQFALPPQGAHISGTMQWLYNQLEPFANKPGGTSHAPSFWIVAALGVALASTRLLGVAAGLVVLSGFVLAAFRIMPLFERLSLWLLPALYLAIALAADRVIVFFRNEPWKQRSLPLIGAGVAGVMVVTLCLDIVNRGSRDVPIGPPPAGNRSTDDRSAVAWLMQQRRPGDILITTGHAQPAIWWYGRMPYSQGGRWFADGGELLIAEHHRSRRVCRGREPETMIDGRHRIQLYLGFPDTPPGFDDLLLDRLSKFGTITAVQHFTGLSRAAVIDPGAPGGSGLFWIDGENDMGASLGGCIAIVRARPW